MVTQSQFSGGEKAFPPTAKAVGFHALFSHELRRHFAIHSYITSIDDDFVYIEGGEDIGIKPNYRYAIMRPEEYTEIYGDSFICKVGFLEVSDVISYGSRGRVIYALDPIMEGDILVESPSFNRKMRGLSFKTLQHSLSDTERGIIPLVEVLFSTERPFSHASGYAFGLSFGASPFSLLAFGIERSLEYPLLGGRFYLDVKGSLDYLIASQSYSKEIEESGSASDSTFYASGELGIKYYLNFEEGSCIKLGLNGLYSGELSSWTRDDRDVNNYMEYPNINLRGVGFMLTYTLPLDTLRPSLPFF